MGLGSHYDRQIFKLLALTPMSASRLGKEIKISDGPLALHLSDHLAERGLIKIVGAAGPNPVWGLTVAGRRHGRHLRFP